MNSRNNMTESERLIARYLDGELSRREEAELQRRLASDPALAEELQQYAMLDEQLAAMGQADVPGVDYDAQRAEIFGALERKTLLEGPPRRRLLFVKPTWAALAAAAVVVLAASVLWQAFRNGGAPAPDVSVAVLSVTPADMGPAELSVRMVRPGGAVMLPEPGDLGLPAGTVTASVGHARSMPQAASPMEWFAE